MNTPGPWLASRYNGNGSHWNIRNEHHGCTVANVFHFVGSITGTSESFDGEKNAHLIAAAPELLAALEACMPWVDAAIESGLGEHHNEATDAYHAARAAIRKAKGES